MERIILSSTAYASIRSKTISDGVCFIFESCRRFYSATGNFINHRVDNKERMKIIETINLLWA